MAFSIVLQLGRFTPIIPIISQELWQDARKDLEKRVVGLENNMSVCLATLSSVLLKRRNTSFSHFDINCSMTHD